MQDLLEKSRIVHQAPNERNFHIFYQLCFGAADDEKEQYHIKNPEYYTYLNQSKCYKVDTIDDEGDFEQLKVIKNSVLS